jgi:hypothetical protein
MAFQGIDTSFNTPDTLLKGAVKINANFKEIYDAFGDGDILFGSTSTIQVSELNSSGNATNIINGVGAIRFDQDSGFDVFDLGNGAVKISMNSTFKTWEVDGQPSLVAVGLDTVRFVAGENVTIETDISGGTKSIIFSNTGISTSSGFSVTGVITSTTFEGTLVGVASTAQNALALDGELPSYYLDYNNFLNTPTNLSEFVDDVGIATSFDVATLQAQVNALGTNLNVVGFYDALSGIITSLTIVGQTRGYLGVGQTLASSGIQTGDYLIVSRGGTSVSPATYLSPGITSAYSGDWIVGVSDSEWSIISYSSQVVAPRSTRSDFARTLESDSNVNTTGIITAASFVGDGSSLSGIITSILAGSNIVVDVTAGIATITSTASGVGAGTSVTISDTPPLNPTEGNLWYDSSIGRAFVYYNDGTSSQWVDFSPSYPLPDVDVYWNKTNSGINTLSNVGIGTTNPTSTLTIIGNQYISGVVTSVNGFIAGTTTKGAYGSNNIVYDADTFWGNIRFNSNNLELYPGGITDGVRGDIVFYKKSSFGQRDEIGRLDGNTGTLNLNGGVNSSGVITATSFIGDGSGLTNIVATGSGVEIRDNDITVGTASTINFGNNISVSPISAGVVTVTATGGGGESYWVQTDVGIHTLSNVGIGTTNATSALTVFGTTTTTNLVSTNGANIDGLQIAQDSLTGTGNIRIGDSNTLGSNTGGNYNIAIGQEALDNIRNGDNNIAIGYQVGKVLNASDSNYGSNVLIGYQSFLNMDGSSNNVAVGYRSLYGSTNFGSWDAIQMTALGGLSGYNLQNSRFSSFFGYQSGYNQTSADYNTFLGYQSGYEITTGDSNVILGSYTGNQNGLDIRTSSNNVVISDGSGNIRLYANSSGNVGIKTTNPTSALTVQGDVNISGVVTATTFVGNFSGSITDATNLTGGIATASQLRVSGVTTITQGRIQADATSNLRFGNLPAGSGSSRNIAIGDQVLGSLSSGLGRNIGIGELSLNNVTSGSYNIGLGIKAGELLSSGQYNVILGAYDGNSGNLDIRTSSNNIVIADGEGNIRQYINSSGNVGIKTTVVTEALTVAGVVSATSFYGTLNAGQLTGALPAIDGSALIGVVGSGSGVVIEDDATPVGTAGTINFGSNLNVSFASGTATVSSSLQWVKTASGIHTLSNVGVGTTNPTSALTVKGSTSLESLSATSAIFTGKVGSTNSYFYEGLDPSLIGSTGGGINGSSVGYALGGFLRYTSTSTDEVLKAYYKTTGEETVRLMINGDFTLKSLAGVTKFAVSGDGNATVGNNLNVSGIITASSFSGSGANLTNLPAGQLTGALPAIDGSALLNVTASGTGVVVEDNQVNVGSATTIDFGTGLDVTFSAGVATVTASGGSLQSRTTVTGVTTSIPNNGIGNTNITGFKSYALMKVGLSTAGWLRLYTDSASRDADVSRSVGEDPTPGSGVIAEVVTTGISTTQIISPFVMGGNLDDPADTTIYAAITNLSGSTQAITANLTILQLEA